MMMMIMMMTRNLCSFCDIDADIHTQTNYRATSNFVVDFLLS